MKFSARATALATVLAALTLGACAYLAGVSSTVSPGKQALVEGEWPYWGGDPQSTRYSPLTDIKSSNVSKLEIVWRWSADTTGSPASANFKSTPLMDDGVLYMPWLDHGMAAIDAATGRTLWTFLPDPRDSGGRAPNLAPRSLAYWTDGRSKRLFHNSVDGRLLAVDGITGKAAVEFGDNGAIDLRTNLTEGRAVTDVGSVSPALVVGDVLVVQVVPGGARNKESTPGHVRGYDVRSGKLLWTFHTVHAQMERFTALADVDAGSFGLPLMVPQTVTSHGHNLVDGLITVTWKNDGTELAGVTYTLQAGGVTPPIQWLESGSCKPLGYC
jgi:quinoprotein glucose dehydrogenase